LKNSVQIIAALGLLASVSCQEESSAYDDQIVSHDNLRVRISNTDGSALPNGASLRANHWKEIRVDGAVSGPIWWEFAQSLDNTDCVTVWAEGKARRV
jgi:hypothetical protein